MLPRYKIVWQFLDKKYATNELANWDIFRKEQPEINNRDFFYTTRQWKKAHLNDPNAMLWFNDVRNKNGLKRVRIFLDQYSKNNEPAGWEEFHNKYPEITNGIFYDGCYLWHKLHQGDPVAMKWFNTIRLGGLSNTERIRRYLDWQCAAGDTISWEDFHKDYPEINHNRFGDANRVWKEEHLDDPEAMLWFNEVRKKNGRKTVQKFLDLCKKNNESTGWEDFHNKYPEFTHKIFHQGINSWHKLHRGDPVAMEWFNSTRVGGPSSCERVRRYLDWQCAAGDIALWKHFQLKYKTISHRSFASGVKSWCDIHTDNAEAMRWYDTVRLGGVSDMEQVRRFMDWQYAANDSMTWRDFHEQHPTIRRNAYFPAISSWRNLHKEDPIAVHWYNTVRLGGPCEMEQVRRFMDWQYAANDSITWRDFHEQHPTIGRNAYFASIYSWRDLHKEDPIARVWYNKRRQIPSNNCRIMTWLDQQYSTRAPAWPDLFLEDNPDLSTSSFGLGKMEWRKKRSNDQDAMNWIGKFTSDRHYSAEVGKSLERVVISDLSRALKPKNINIYYNTKSIESLGQLRGKNLNKAKRVEMRFFVQDLLSAQSGIGPLLKQFLSTTQRPYLAIDLTLGGNNGKKISFYANITTSLLVVNPHGNKSQRSLESHVRVLSLQDFIGPQWFNLDKDTQEEIMKDLAAAQFALFDGPDSEAWHNLKTLEETKWGKVADGLKTDGSQADFQTRVANDIATQLRQGKMPKELTAYSESARAAGHKEHAGEVENLAQVAVAIAQVKKVSHIDPACLAEAREFAKALQAARDADAAREKEHEKKCIDPARLAEAREYAHAIQEARNAERTRVDQVPESGAETMREVGRERSHSANAESSGF